MLDFLKFLSDLGSIERAPWRWWVSLLLGFAGMVLILMHVDGEIAVLYVCLDLVLTAVLASVWQWRADARMRRAAGGR